MVTSGSLRRSVRPALSALADFTYRTRPAAFVTAAGQAEGRLNISIAASVSTRGSRGLTQNADNPALGFTARPRVLHDLQLDDLAGLRTGTITVRHDEVMGRTPGTDHPADAVLALIAANHAVTGAGKNLHNRPAAAATTTLRGDPDHHPVTIQQGPHLGLGQVNINRSVVGNQKTETIAMRTDRAGHQIELFAEAILTSPG